MPAVWIFNLDNDILTLHKKSLNRMIPLSKLREGPVSIADMEPFELPPLPKFTLDKDFPTPTWEPKFNAATRQTAFIGRVLEDFSYQWRHVFRSRYNNSTFRRLACAILRIVTLDFNVKEVARSRAGIRGTLVWLTDLPQWEPFPNRVIHLDRVSVVLCQHLTHAIPAIREDFGRRRVRYESSSPRNARCNSITYLILSVREIILYRTCFCNTHSPICTRPEPLFNGVDSPSKRALGYLLMAAPPERQASPLHDLPVEIQDMILRNVSMGPVESARVGCMLSLGSVFKWERDGVPVRRQEVLTNRTWVLPVESQIWFDNCLSGLAYR